MILVTHVLMLQQKLGNAPITDDAFDTFASNSIVSRAAPAPAPASVPSPMGATPPVPVSTVNLLDFDDSHPVVPHTPPPPSPSAIRLQAGVTLTPQVFQQLWGGSAEAFSGRVGALTRPMTASTEIEAALRQVSINTMASGPLPQPDRGFKLFLFAQEESLTATSPFLVQLLLNTNSSEVSAVVKAPAGTQQHTINAFMELLASIIRRF